MFARVRYVQVDAAAMIAAQLRFRRDHSGRRNGPDKFRSVFTANASAVPSIKFPVPVKNSLLLFVRNLLATD